MPLSADAIGVLRIQKYKVGGSERVFPSPTGDTIQNGVDMKTVSSMLGHYSAGFTLDTYAYVTTDAQLKAAQTMGNILSGAV